MKLLSFAVTDRFAWNRDKLFKHVDEMLVDEADVRGWADGYTFDTFQDPEHLLDGSVRYFFEVNGEYAEGEGEDGERRGATAGPATPRPEAAKEADA